MSGAELMQWSKLRLKEESLDEFLWTTGHDVSVTLNGRIDSGACGDVFQVKSPVFLIF